MELYQKTHLKCSIGVGWNRFLAKMGSDYKKPLGLIIFTKENYQSMLYPLSIGKMYGIGVKTAPRLEALGIHTLGDLANDNSPEVKAVLGKSYQGLKDALHGIASDVVSTDTYDPKSISAERTFANDENSFEDVLAMLRLCCEEVVKEMLHYQKRASTICLKIRDNNFVTKSKRVSLARPSNRIEDLFLAARNLLEEMMKNTEVRLIGIGVEKFESETKAASTTDSFLKEINESLKEGGKIYTLGGKKE